MQHTAAVAVPRPAPANMANYFTVPAQFTAEQLEGAAVPASPGEFILGLRARPRELMIRR